MPVCVDCKVETDDEGDFCECCGLCLDCCECDQLLEELDDDSDAYEEPKP